MMIKLKNIVEIQSSIYLKPSPVANSLYLQVNNFDSNGSIHSRLKPTIALDSTNIKYLLSEKDLLLFKEIFKQKTTSITPKKYTTKNHPYYFYTHHLVSYKNLHIIHYIIYHYNLIKTDK